MNRRNNGRSAGMTRQTAPPWLLVALFLLLQGGGAWSQSVRLAQIDASRLLTRQATDLYVAVTDEEGNSIEGLSSGQFEILESTDGQQFTPAPITDFDANPHATGGVTFLLLVDNSGSMYDTIEGEPTEDPSEQRIAAARGAIREFLDSIDNPLDRVGLASFNTYYRRHREPAHSTEAVESALEEIEEPTREEAFTELYRAISLAAEDLAAVPGRTVLVVLSDGENYPFATHREAPHPTYEQDVVEAEAALEALQREGIGAFAVNFATAGDPQLVEIVNESGGLLYDAETGDELAGVYEEIRRRVLDEYRITYRPSLAPGERRYVRVRFAPSAGGAVETTRVYITSTIFGLPAENFGWLYLIPLLGAILGALLLGLLRFRNSRTDPNLEVLDPRGRATQVLSLTSEKTIIGSSNSADLTVAESPDMREQHATILYDDKKGTYTVVSDTPIKVNNRKTTNRELTPGDVVQLPGATIVFDEPAKKE
ncbi:MAG: VWA domain-containing protein [Spirochaetaceae bacterium]